MLVFLIECTSEDLKDDYKTLLHELESFNPEILEKPQVIAITKMDIADDDVRKKLKKVKFPKGIPTVSISSATGDGLKDLLDIVWKELSKSS